MEAQHQKAIPQPRRSWSALGFELSGLRHLSRTLLAKGISQCSGNSPVVVLPGFQTGPMATWPMRRYLGGYGLTVMDWGLGRNHGNAWQLVPAVIERLESGDAFSAGASQYALLGWSQGGFNAREVARQRPDLVSQVITLGTPVIGGPKYTIVGDAYQRKGYDLDEIEAEVAALQSEPIEVPITAFYSRDDRVVSWQACIDHMNPQVEHVEVGGSHVALGLRRDVLDRVAARLCRSSLA